VYYILSLIFLTILKYYHRYKMIQQCLQLLGIRQQQSRASLLGRRRGTTTATTSSTTTGVGVGVGGGGKKYNNNVLW
jgi:hypothetical protein